MGGQGSGRKPDVIKSMARQTTPIATEPKGESVFLPNYSGVQSAALKTSADISGGGSHWTSGSSILEPSNNERVSGSFIGDGKDLTNLSGSALPTGTAGQQLTYNEAETGYEPVLASKYINARNTSGSTINKGTPVYISGWNAGQSAIEITPADASDDAKMPAVGLVFENISNNANGRVIMLGNTVGVVDTNAWSEGDAVYVSGSVGALINVRPNGTTVNVQKMGTVGRSHSTAGQMTIIGAGRTNDVPNTMTVSGNVESDAYISGSNMYVANTLSGSQVRLTGDNTVSGSAYVPMLLFGTDATPPAASGYPQGSVYIQYTP